MNLQPQLLRSYAGHPGFKFGEREFELDESASKAFNEAYEFVRTFPGRPNRRDAAALATAARTSLDGVFDGMMAQAGDPLEKMFLEELRRACQRLLEEDLGHYRKKLAGTGVALGSIAAREGAMQLRHDRYFFGRIPIAAVNEILAVSATELDEFRRRVRSGHVKRQDLSFAAGPKMRQIRDVLNREFGILGVLDSVSAYFGRRVRVTGQALELSVPQAGWWTNGFAELPRPPRTLYGHLDESIVVPKSIVYLTDVGPTNGPTSCYPGAFPAMSLSGLQFLVGRIVGSVGDNPSSPLHGYYAKQYHQSMTSERFRRHFMRLPLPLRFNSHFGWDVMPDSDAERTLVAHERVMTGPAGTFIAFDGSTLLHRGGMVQEGERIALQVTFTDLTLPKRILGKIKRTFA